MNLGIVDQPFKCCLMGDHPGRNMKDSSSECDLNCGCSEEQNVSIWPRYLPCDILVKNMTIFFPCLGSLHEVKVKSLN